jgi:hypothetical protein
MDAKFAEHVMKRFPYLAHEFGLGHLVEKA